MSNLSGITIDRYHLIEKLGEGGMAVVYKAYDTRLECEVALKIIRTENLPQSGVERAMKRFEREAKSVARLTHANIVKVTDYGEYEGNPYLVMEYLPGGTLKELIKQRGQIPWQEAAQLVIPIAEALDYAHAHNVIHRDIKPSNILLTENGTPMLTDFGVAKIIEEEGTQDLTGTSATVGTPEYMAPEQIVSKTVDHRADIYALGVVFYELVTGRRPYEADTPMAVMIMHSRDPLPRPSLFVKGLPNNLEHFFFKALAKIPEDRFSNMSEFTETLDRLKKQQSPSNKTRGAISFRFNRHDDSVGEFDPNPEKISSLIPPTNVKYSTVDQVQSMEVVKESKKTPRTNLLVTTIGRKGVKRNWIFLSVIGLAFLSLIVLVIRNHWIIPKTEVPSEEVTTTQDFVTPTSTEDTRFASPAEIALMNSNPYAGPVPEDALFRLGKGSIRDMAYFPDGKTLALGGSLGIYLYSMDTYEITNFFPTESGVICIAVSPNGDFVASGLSDGTVVLWDIQNMLEKKVFSSKFSFVQNQSISISPDGRTLAFGDFSSIILLDIGSGNLIQTLEGHSYWISSLSFSPDGKMVASGAEDDTVILWDVATGTKLHTFSGHTATIEEVAFNPDGRTLASGSYDGSIILWDIINGEKLYTYQANKGGVFSVAYAPSGRLLVSGGIDNSIIVWDTTTSEKIRTLEDHTDLIGSLAFAPNGETLASESSDGRIIIWNTIAWQKVQIITGFQNIYADIAFSPVDPIIASDGGGNSIILWDLEKKEILRILNGHTAIVTSVAFSPDGKTIASGSYDGRVILWDVNSGIKLRVFNAQTTVASVSFSPDGCCVASESGDNSISIWDIKNGNKLHTLTGHTSTVLGIAYSPDGQTIASGSVDKTVKLWDINTGELLRTFSGHADAIRSVAFSPDGKILASESDDGNIFIWDLASGKKTYTLKGNPHWAKSIAFSPNSRFLASGYDHKVILWNPGNGDKVETYSGFYYGLDSITFSPNGRMLAGVGDSTVLFWNIDE